MRYIKMLGLAAIAALASMAFIGASSASADVICLAHEDPCSVANSDVHKEIVAHTNAAELLAGTFSTTCLSEVKGLSTTNLGNHLGLEGEISEVSFKNCTGACKKVKEEKAENLPWKVVALGLDVTLELEGGVKHTYQGSLHVSDPVEHGLAGLLLECPLGASCLYGTTSATVHFLLHTPAEGEKPLVPAFIDALVSLLKVGHSLACPSTGQWHAKYEVKQPTGLIDLAALTS